MARCPSNADHPNNFIIDPWLPAGWVWVNVCRVRPQSTSQRTEHFTGIFKPSWFYKVVATQNASLDIRDDNVNASEQSCLICGWGHLLWALVAA